MYALALALRTGYLRAREERVHTREDHTVVWQSVGRTRYRVAPLRRLSAALLELLAGAASTRFVRLLLLKTLSSPPASLQVAAEANGMGMLRP